MYTGGLKYFEKSLYDPQKHFLLSMSVLHIFHSIGVKVIIKIAF